MLLAGLDLRKVQQCMGAADDDHPLLEAEKTAQVMHDTHTALPYLFPLILVSEKSIGFFLLNTTRSWTGFETH